MSTTNTDTLLPGKPIPLRVIFILNGIMMFLPFIFYAVITSKNIDVGGLDPVYMIYTGIGYIASFTALVFFILHRNIMGVRLIILLNVLIALPAKAYLGIIVAVVSFGLTFNKRVKSYFLVE